MNIPSGYTALDLIGFTDKGAYNSATSYVKNDLVSYNGEKWRCKLDDTVNHTPEEGTYWTIFIDAPSALDDLADVTISSVANGNILEYDSATSKWKNSTGLSEVKQALANQSFVNGAVNILPNSASSATITTDGANLTYVVNDDGTVLVNGSAGTSNINFNIIASKAKFNPPSGSYKLTGCPSNAPSGAFLQTYDEGVTAVNDTGNGVIVTHDNSKMLVVRIRVNAGVTVSNLTFKPMLTLPDMPNSDYAHYVPYAKSNRQLTDDLATESATVPIYTHANSDVEYATFKKTGNVVSMSLNFTLNSGDTPLSTGLLTSDGAVPAAYRPEYASGATCIIAARDNTTFSLASYYFAFIVVSKSGAITLRGKDTELANCVGFSGTLTYVI